MPRPLEANQKFPLWLARDAEKVPRPTFYFRAVTAREYLAALAAVRESGASPLAAALDFLASALVGWDNLVDERQQPPQAIPFDAARLADVVDADEAVELFYGFTLSPEEKKSSESPRS